MQKAKVIFISIFILAILTVSGFKIIESNKKTPFWNDWIEVTDKMCEESWWKIEKVGKAQIEMCVMQFSDWWKECSSSNECEWECIKKDIDGKAFCAAKDQNLGCYNSVENIEKGEGILCID